MAPALSPSDILSYYSGVTSFLFWEICKKFVSMSNKGQSLWFLYLYQWFYEASKFSQCDDLEEVSFPLRRDHKSREIAQRKQAAIFCIEALGKLVHSSFQTTVISTKLLWWGYWFGTFCVVSWDTQTVRQDTALAIISIYLHTLSSLSVFSQDDTRQTAWLCSDCLPQPRSRIKYRPSKYSLRKYDMIWYDKIWYGLILGKCLSVWTLLVLISQWP